MLTIPVKSISWSSPCGLCYGVIEASQLELKPGEWPVAVVVEGRTRNELFLDTTLPHPSSIAEANERGRVYRTKSGQFVLHILND